MNLEYQSNSFLFDNNQSGHLFKMNSSVNLYDYLTNHISWDDDGSNQIAMTSSTSSDSAIVIDDCDDKQIKYRNSWPKMLEKNEVIFTSFSQSFDLLNRLEQQINTESDQSISKYKHPLPWINHSNKVFWRFVVFFLKS